MAAADRVTAREAKRLQTRERLMGAATAEFKRTGMAQADVSAIVTAAGVAHGTFFFHFPTKEHVLLELERREEDRIAKQFRRFLKDQSERAGVSAVLAEAVRMIMDLELRLGDALFNDFLALHFSQTRPAAQGGGDHPLIVLVAEQIEGARDRGDIDPEVDPMNSAIFFLLGLYALLITTHEWPTRRALVDDYVARTIRSLQPPA